MTVFSYDGSLEGLLCVVFDAYTIKSFPEIILGPDDVPPLMATSIHTVVTKEEHAQRVFIALKKKLPDHILRQIMDVWLSEMQGTDSLLYSFIIAVFDTKKASYNDFSDPVMRQMASISKKVRSEAHLVEGFARFQETKDNGFVAIIGPSHNVLPLILPHFTNRFRQQRFAIYDNQRKYGMCSDGKSLHNITLEEDALLQNALQKDLLSDKEKIFEDTWKQYCKNISITERSNAKLQRSLMPKKFWKYMTENRD